MTQGNAHGSDPAVHRISDGAFVCAAPPDAPCRTSPTCECETWCGCDGSPQDAVDSHGEGGHCCMTTAEPGQGAGWSPGSSPRESRTATPATPSTSWSGTGIAPRPRGRTVPSGATGTTRCSGSTRLPPSSAGGTHG